MVLRSTFKKLAWVGITVLGMNVSDFVMAEETSKNISLAEALDLMKEHHPRIKAAQASLRGSEAGLKGVQNLPLFAKFSTDLKIRKQQSALGIEVTDAGLRQEIRDTSYGVARAYYLVIYSKQQILLTEHILTILTKNIKALELKMLLKKTPADEVSFRWCEETFYRTCFPQYQVG